MKDLNNEIQKLEQELDSILNSIVGEQEIKDTIKPLVMKILELKNDELNNLKLELDIVESLPNNNYVFIVSDNNGKLSIKWKSKKFENVNENLLLYKIKTLNYERYFEQAKVNHGEMINLDIVFVLNEKKYFMSILHNGNNGYFNIYLKPAIMIKQNIVDSLESMLKAAELRDPETKEHLDRISSFSKVLLEKLQHKGLFNELISSDFIEDVFLTSPLHDLGKVGIPDHILLKNGKLTDEEFSIMKEHAEKGGKLMKGLMKKFGEINILITAENIATFHHEKYDGSGYPFGLVGNEIPLEARVVTIVDVFDSLKSKRPYKDSFSDEETKKILLEGSSKHFDPEILDVFFENWDEFLQLRKTLLGDNEK